MSVAKEVQAVLDLGILDEEQTKVLYHEILKNFGTSPDASKTQKRIYDMRKNNRTYYHALIDDVCKRYDPSLSWRTVKFEPSRTKRCIICQRIITILVETENG